MLSAERPRRDYELPLDVAVSSEMSHLVRSVRALAARARSVLVRHSCFGVASRETSSTSSSSAAVSPVIYLSSESEEEEEEVEVSPCCASCHAVGLRIELLSTSNYDEDNGEFYCSSCWEQWSELFAQVCDEPATPSPRRPPPSHELLCSITLDLMADPVLLAGDGYTYEREAIEAWLNVKQTSPMTNLALSPRSTRLVTNRAVKTQCDGYVAQCDAVKAAAVAMQAAALTIPLWT